jgi:hypothetical protein
VSRAAKLRAIDHEIGAANLELDNGESVSPLATVARERAQIHALVAIAMALRFLCDPRGDLTIEEGR